MQDYLRHPQNRQGKQYPADAMMDVNQVTKIKVKAKRGLRGMDDQGSQ
jgi:hypothetical protein